MSLWGNKDYPTSNNKPLFANTSTTTSSSTINGTAANTNQYYGVVVGVSATEQNSPVTASNTHPAHAGWVSLKFGTGGRAGRMQAETLVAMGSMTFDDPKDNVWFSTI